MNTAIEQPLEVQSKADDSMQCLNIRDKKSRGGEELPNISDQSFVRLNEKQRRIIVPVEVFPNGGISKTRIIESNEYQPVGQHWLTIIAIETLCKVNTMLWTMMQQRHMKVAYTVWIILCCGMYLSAYVNIALINRDQLNSLGFTTCMVAAAFASLSLLTHLLRLCYTCYRYNENCIENVCSWALLFDSCTLAYLAIVMLCEGDNLSALFISALCLTSFVHNVAVVLWTGLMPLILLLGIVESCFRLLCGQFTCPRVEKKKREYHYQTFKYNQVLRLQETRCTICLCDFQESEAPVCVLLCQIHHIFHEDCILAWANTQHFCPVCRGDIRFFEG